MAGTRVVVQEIGAVIHGPARVCMGGDLDFTLDPCGNDPAQFTYRWECGDNGAFDDGTLDTVTCNFSSPGLVSVELEVSDGASGITQVSERTVFVEQPPDFAFGDPECIATDGITCDGAGIQLTWDNCPATWNNETATGDYNVYRAVSADGVTCPPEDPTDPAWTLINGDDDGDTVLDPVGTSYLDTGTATGTFYCYLVMAEDTTPNSACTQGPRNGGASSVVLVGPVEDADNPDVDPAIDVGNYLMAVRAGGGISWDWGGFTPPVQEIGLTYRVVRASGSPCFANWGPPFVADNVTGTSAADPPFGLGRLFFYDVRTKDQCGNVSPVDPALNPADPTNCRYNP
jgi:hypothetical protein